MYVGNLNKTVTESDLGELFGLRTNYLEDNCSIEMSKFQQNEKHNCHTSWLLYMQQAMYTFILAPCHICNKLVKLHGLEFHGNGVRSRLPIAPTEKQHPIENINSAFAVIPKKKNFALFSDIIPREMKIKG